MNSIGLHAQTACIWEATARKPGNVHRYQDFNDVGYTDFLLSAAAIALVFDDAPNQPIGETVLRGVRATRQVVSTNTNLGILLLLAPLAKVTRFDQVNEILHGTTVEDAHAVYEAIRLASPGGMGNVEKEDVADSPTLTLLETMRLAVDRDAIAREYANGFRVVLDVGVPVMERWLDHRGRLETAIVGCALELLSLLGDTLIQRKCGYSISAQARSKAKHVLDSGWPDSDLARVRFDEFDAWLRGDNHRRNPGTTADLVTATLFVMLRSGKISLPSPYTW